MREGIRPPQQTPPRLLKLPQSCSSPYRQYDSQASENEISPDVHRMRPQGRAGIEGWTVGHSGSDFGVSLCGTVVVLRVQNRSARAGERETSCGNGVEEGNERLVGR